MTIQEELRKIASSREIAIAQEEAKKEIEKKHAQERAQSEEIRENLQQMQEVQELARVFLDAKAKEVVRDLRLLAMDKVANGEYSNFQDKNSVEISYKLIDYYQYVSNGDYTLRMKLELENAEYINSYITNVLNSDINDTYKNPDILLERKNPNEENEKYILTIAHSRFFYTQEKKEKTSKSISDIFSSPKYDFSIKVMLGDMGAFYIGKIREYAKNEGLNISLKCCCAYNYKYNLSTQKKETEKFNLGEWNVVDSGKSMDDDKEYGIPIAQEKNPLKEDPWRANVDVIVDIDF